MEWPADEAHQHGMPGLEGLLHHLACCRVATLTCCTALWILTADMLSRSLHASRRRSYDRCGLPLTMPTRSGNAHALLAGKSHRHHAVGESSHSPQLRQCGVCELTGQRSNGRTIMCGSQNAQGPASVGGLCRTYYAGP